MYAKITDGNVAEVWMPTAARRLDTGEWVLGLHGASFEHQQACGYFVVAATPRPSDIDTHTYDRSIALLDGTPTVTWTKRAKRADELAVEVAQINTAEMGSKLQLLLTTNSSFLAESTPTNAQVLAQVKALTRQSNILIRLLLRGNLLNSTLDT